MKSIKTVLFCFIALNLTTICTAQELTLNSSGQSALAPLKVKAEQSLVYRLFADLVNDNNSRKVGMVVIPSEIPKLNTAAKKYLENIRKTAEHTIAFSDEFKNIGPFKINITLGHILGQNGEFKNIGAIFEKEGNINIITVVVDIKSFIKSGLLNGTFLEFGFLSSTVKIKTDRELELGDIGYIYGDTTNSLYKVIGLTAKGAQKHFDPQILNLTTREIIYYRGNMLVINRHGVARVILNENKTNYTDMFNPLQKENPISVRTVDCFVMNLNSLIQSPKTLPSKETNKAALTSL